ncbi:PASTA domain-containing protein [Patiriisocius sp. Uisw_047]|jgi:beta-lactam-binding protein with PASTA domain|uniref:PASTA domain-containing protein n=1 Tax=Patiriisocius sp. Uisw_047 TaxID=3230969 RepID=UPI0039EBAE76
MNFFRFLFTKTFIKQLLFAVVALVILVFLLMLWLKSTTNHGETIKVPNLSKMQLDKVEDTLDGMDLRYEVMDSANYNPEYPQYSVIEQLPKAGKLVKEDRKIYLALNPSGYTKIPVPNVVGITRRQGERTLLATGFKIGKISTRPYIAKDEILELRYKGEKLTPGTKLGKTTVIDLVIGDGAGSLHPGSDTTEINDDGE